MSIQCDVDMVRSQSEKRNVRWEGSRDQNGPIRRLEFYLSFQRHLVYRPLVSAQSVSHESNGDVQDEKKNHFTTDDSCLLGQSRPFYWYTKSRHERKLQVLIQLSFGSRLVQCCCRSSSACLQSGVFFFNNNGLLTVRCLDNSHDNIYWQSKQLNSVFL